MDLFLQLEQSLQVLTLSQRQVFVARVIHERKGRMTMSELDEMRDRYRMLAGPKVPAQVQANIEQMISQAETARPPVREPRFGRQRRWLLTHRQRFAGGAAGVAAVAIAAGIITAIYTHTGSSIQPAHPGQPTLGAGKSLLPQPGPSYFGAWYAYLAAVIALFAGSVGWAIAAFRRRTRWFVRGLSLFACLAFALMLFDQWQGGPVGREFHGSGGGEGATTVVGKGWVFGVGATLVDPTWIPIEVLSVRPINHPAGVDLTAGVWEGGALGAIYLKNHRQNLLTTPVSVPRGQGLLSRPAYQPVLAWAATRPGQYDVRGLYVTYRWGPFFYRAKIGEPGFTLSVPVHHGVVNH